MIKSCKQAIPWAMAAGRALLGPILVLGERCGWSGTVLASMVVTALISDIFDGVLARRWKCDTAGVRLFDSVADTAFYFCVGGALWLRDPRIWHGQAILLGGLLCLEAMRAAVDFAKFGKPASYHSWLAKTWGLVMATGVILAFASSRGHGVVRLSLALGLACNLEGMAMSVALPVWRRDVKTLAAALRIRSELRRGSWHDGGRCARPVVWLGGAMLLISCMFLVHQATALEPGKAIYIGGSAAVASGTSGSLDTSSTTILAFDFNSPNGRAGQIRMEYANVLSVLATNEVAHHLGVAPAIAVGLLAARQRRYFLVLTWKDEAGISQAAQIEVSKQDQQPLLAVIRVRMPRPCPLTSSRCIQKTSHGPDE